MPLTLGFNLLFSTLAFIVGNAQNLLSSHINWCDRAFSCSGQNNSMCLYGPETNKSNCINMVEEFVNKSSDSSGWREYWLALHNTFRDKVAAGRAEPWPFAANMRQLTWNPNSTLSEQASIWNFQCQLTKADRCNRNEEYRETQIGQVRIYLKYDDLHDHGGGNDFYVREFLKEVFLEVVNQYKNVPASTLIKEGYQGNIYGLPYFFSVLLYGDSKEMGGSLIRSIWVRNPNRAVFSNTYIAPWYKGLPVYTEGYPCSGCPAGLSCNKNSTYKYLCALPGDPDDGEYVEGVPGVSAGNLAIVTVLPLSLSLVLVANRP